MNPSNKIVEMVKSSLFVLAHSILDYKDVTMTTHGEVITALESSNNRKLIVLPRGCLKSSLCTIAFPIFALNRNPNERILIDSELYGNSCTYLREITYHLEGNENLRKLFGEYKGSLWNQDEIIIKQRTKPYKEASITAGGIGTTRVGQHYSIILGDDYNSPRNTASKENAEKVIAHYQYNLSILEPGGIYIVVGTRYSENDLIGHIILNELGLKTTPLTGVYNLSTIEKSIEQENIL
jgi:hypothetical protein